MGQFGSKMMGFGDIYTTGEKVPLKEVGGKLEQKMVWNP